MALEAAYLLPHPPILIPEVGGKNSAIVSRTNKALKFVADEVNQSNFDHFYLTSPHMPVSEQYIIYHGEAKGSLSGFGANDVQVHLSSSKLVCEVLNQEALSAGLNSRCVAVSRNEDILDHGTVVPIWSIFGHNKVECVPFSLAWGDGQHNFQFGRSLSKAAGKTGKRTALIVSGDLSHRLIEGAPAGYSPKGEEFDRLIHDIFDSGDLGSFFGIDKQLAREAGHCGLPGLQLMAGVADGKAIDSTVHSYEGPFGVGYMVASVKVKSGS